MSYIYVIENDVNQKKYIGKTEYSIEKRFKEHCSDAYRKRNQNRPLYSAMRKYGIDHFHISIIQQTNQPEQRQIYWIKQMKTYEHGYNATRGGDGKNYIDPQVIIDTYLKLKQVNLVCKQCSVTDKTAHKILNNNNIEIKCSSEILKQKLSVQIEQFNIQGEYISTFASPSQAARMLKPNSKSIYGVASQIRNACKGKQKTAYGYVWKFSDNNIDQPK